MSASCHTDEKEISRYRDKEKKTYFWYIYHDLHKVANMPAGRPQA